MRNFWTACFLLCAFPLGANASDFCATMFDGFAAEMEEIASSYDRMKTDDEVCRFGRGTDIPARKRILATVEANQSKCKNGAAAVNFARESLQNAVSQTNEACRKAGL